MERDEIDRRIQADIEAKMLWASKELWKAHEPLYIPVKIEGEELLNTVNNLIEDLHSVLVSTPDTRDKILSLFFSSNFHPRKFSIDRGHVDYEILFSSWSNYNGGYNRELSDRDFNINDYRGQTSFEVKKNDSLDSSVSENVRFSINQSQSNIVPEVTYRLHYNNDSMHDIKHENVEYAVEKAYEFINEIRDYR